MGYNQRKTERGKAMKKRLIVILATLMCISLCACGGNESTSGEIGTENQTTQNETTENTEDGKPIEGEDYTIGEDGTIGISKKYCAENMTLVEITTENWKEYFQVVEETTKSIDSFGELQVITKTVAKPYLEGKYVYGFYNHNNPESRGAFEFTDTYGYTYPHINLYSGDKLVYTIDDFELTKVSATLMLLNIPDELWNIDENGIEYVLIGNPNNPFLSTYQSGEEVDHYTVEDIIEESK